VSIVLSLMAFGLTAPAQAAGSSAASQTARIAAGSGAPNLASAAQTLTGGPAKACQTGNLRTLQRCADTGTQQLSEGGCGFMQRCLYFSRGEQLIIVAGASATIIAAICTASAGVACAIASGIVGAAFQWLSNRGGICGTKKPRLRVQWFPRIIAEGCVD